MEDREDDPQAPNGEQEHSHGTEEGVDPRSLVGNHDEGEALNDALGEVQISGIQA